MLKVSKWWFIATYIVAMILFIVYEILNEGVMLDTFAHNLPAGTNSQIFIMANVLSVIAAFAYAEGDNRKRILRSFCLYALVSSVTFLLAPTYTGVVGGAIMFILTGLYHTRLIDEKKLFSFLGEDGGFLSDTQAKYLLWGTISFMVFILGYWKI